MSNINVKIKPNLPLNVVQIAHIGSDTPNVANAVAIEYKDINPGLANFPFLKDYSFDVILNDNQTVGELGVGVAGLLDNNISITNVASASRFGNSIPLFYKYFIANLTIVMPVNQTEYTALKLSATTAEEIETLADMEAAIDSSILDRIYFTDLFNETQNIKFNISKVYISGNNFDITVYVPDSSQVIGSLYIVYSNGTTLFKKILNSVPVFNRKAWHLGNVFYGDLE